MNKNQSTVSDKVIRQIKDGKVQMRPAIYFTILSFITIILSLISSVAISYSSSIIFFWIRVISSNTGAYGARRNLSESIALFPWWTLLIIAVAIISLIILIGKHGDAYKHKTSKILFIILAISIIAGFIMSSFGISNYAHSNYNSQGTNQNNTRWKN